MPWRLGSWLTAAHFLQISMSHLPISCPFSLPTPSDLLFTHFVLFNEEQSISLQIKCEENSLHFKSVKGAIENRLLLLEVIWEGSQWAAVHCHKSF